MYLNHLKHLPSTHNDLEVSLALYSVLFLIAWVYGSQVTVLFLLHNTEDCTGRAGMPCDANAMCEELRGRNNFTCTCIPPFVGDGFMCSRTL